MKKIYNTLLIFTLILIPLTSFYAQNRGVGVRTNTSSQTKRIALVIGNGNYQHTSKLLNPVNDATDMTATLRSLGFEVISGTNQSKRQMQNLIRKFGDRLTDTKGVGLFFYAGHGVAAGGVNYLIPVDADIQAEDEIDNFSISMEFLLGKLNSAQNGFNMVILDACRNNPFARSWRNFRDIGDKGGLARVNAPTGTLIAYATKPGDVASDGDGRNGLYTSALLKQMKVKNVDVTKMLQNVRRDVLEKSGNQQVPFDESSLVGDFYFAGKNGEDLQIKANTEPVQVEIDANAGERAVWNQIKNSNERRDYELFLRTFPKGVYTSQARQKYEQVWWADIKSSTKRSDYEAFKKEFPGGQYAIAAEFALKRMEKPKTKPGKFKTQTFNIAPGKYATQSSNYYDPEWGRASKAIDGDSNGEWGGKSVSHTSQTLTANPWWELDLGGVYEIDKIKIWNRTDCCSERLSRFEILVRRSANDQWERFGIEHIYTKGEIYPLTFEVSKHARYIRIQLKTNGILSLAEVKVFGRNIN